ncbi:hypothetical protein M0R45_002376 [Rubus argutus]|uniref:F-box domain-containing protein n=1 Tax=Rubus argutus TaxID=59490 RepID=A0AAW1VNB1_RUBAR
MAPHLPLEVITEILANLPVKSLLKYRLVCKSWCSLISSPQFVRKHLSSNISNPKRIIQLTPGQDLMFYSLHESIVVYERLKVQKSLSGSKTQIFIASIIRNSMLSVSWVLVMVCDDYKVLTLLPPEKSIENYKDFRGHKSMMYSLRTNSWRRIQDFPLDISYRLVYKSATFVNGALHWMASPGSSITTVIVSLDLASETYMEVPQPDHYGSQIGIAASSRGCLCLLVHNYASQSYDIWVMKEYGLRESWTISVRIPEMVDGISFEHLMIYSSCPHGDVYVESLVSPNAYSNREAKEIGRLNINVRRMRRVMMNL